MTIRNRTENRRGGLRLQCVVALSLLFSLVNVRWVTELSSFSWSSEFKEGGKIPVSIELSRHGGDQPDPDQALSASIA
jgi:hypothetical protein